MRISSFCRIKSFSINECALILSSLYLYLKFLSFLAINGAAFRESWKREEAAKETFSFMMQNKTKSLHTK